jgi:hypothetical protein
MAIVADLTTAVPYLSTGTTNVYAWEIGVTFTNGVPADSDYYQSEFFTTVEFDDPNYGFSLVGTAGWTTQDQLTALVDMDHYSAVFEEQVTSVSTPPGELTAVTGYSVP